MSIVVVLGIFVFTVNNRTMKNSYALAYDLDSKSILSKTINDDNISDNLINCDCEKTFNKEYPIVWSGKVIATFVGGEDIGVERYSQEFKYNKFYVIADGKYNDSLGSDIRVRGRLVGITCAHANSVFKQCVGEVIADSITPFIK